MGLLLPCPKNCPPHLWVVSFPFSSLRKENKKILQTEPRISFLLLGILTFEPPPKKMGGGGRRDREKNPTTTFFVNAALWCFYPVNPNLNFPNPSRCWLAMAESLQTFLRVESYHQNHFRVESGSIHLIRAGRKAKHTSAKSQFTISNVVFFHCLLHFSWFSSIFMYITKFCVFNLFFSFLVHNVEVCASSSSLITLTLTHKYKDNCALITTLVVHTTLNVRTRQFVL